MNDERVPRMFDDEPGIRIYMIVCLGGLMAILAGLMERRVGLSSLLFPLLVGGCALLLRWRSGPVWLVLSLLWVLWAAARNLDLLQSMEFWGINPQNANFDWRPLSDGAICAGVLLYSASSYRLQGLVLHLFPQELRRQPSSFGIKHGIRPSARLRRSVESVAGTEIARLVMLAAGCAGAASLLWLWLTKQKTEVGPSADHWHVMLLVWLFGIGLIVAASVLGYLGQRRMTPDDAALYLQDVVWRETPREQRRLMSWLAWARLRRKTREVEP